MIWLMRKSALHLMMNIQKIHSKISVLTINDIFTKQIFVSKQIQDITALIFKYLFDAKFDVNYIIWYVSMKFLPRIEYELRNYANLLTLRIQRGNSEVWGYHLSSDIHNCRRIKYTRIFSSKILKFKSCCQYVFKSSNWWKEFTNISSINVYSNRSKYPISSPFFIFSY